MLQILQQELKDIAALKLEDTWREKGEKFPASLKRLHKTRTSQQYIASLQTPDSPRYYLSTAGSGAEALQEGLGSAVVQSGSSTTGAAQGILL